MQTIETLKSLGVLKNLRSLSNNVKNSPKNKIVREFSFSPEQKTENFNGLKDIFSFKPESSQSTIPKKSKKKSPHFSTKKSEKATIKKKTQKKGKIAEENDEKKSGLTKNEKIQPQPNPVENNPVRKVSIKEFLNRNYTQELLKFESKKNCRPVTPLDRIDGECTFKPILGEKSKELAGSNRKIDLYELGERRKIDRNSKIEEAIKKKEEEEMKNCTFAPKILKKTTKNPSDTSRLTPDVTYASKYYKNVSPKKVNIIECIDH